MLFIKYINTPIGELTAVASKHSIKLLKFTDSIDKNFLKAIENYEHNQIEILEFLSIELKEYFQKPSNIVKHQKLKFSTPLDITATCFQTKVYQYLNTIPYGKTLSYLDIAQAISSPKSYRAVALACANNNFHVVIPCHRVIAKNGNISGYNAGVHRKKWLLQHEQIC